MHAGYYVQRYGYTYITYTYAYSVFTTVYALYIQNGNQLDQHYEEESFLVVRGEGGGGVVQHADLFQRDRKRQQQHIYTQLHITRVHTNNKHSICI